MSKEWVYPNWREWNVLFHFLKYNFTVRLPESKQKTDWSVFQYYYEMSLFCDLDVENID